MADKKVIGQLAGILTVFSDGSFERAEEATVPACSTFHGDVASSDVTLDPDNGLWARIFMPQVRQTTEKKKLPVVLYFHGGGFCLGTPSVGIFHDFCSRLASRSSCIWISVHYRLAPEHRLPAAYDDSFTALLWLCAQALQQSTPLTIQGTDRPLGLQWLHQYADFANTFFVGESAGGTIIHFLAARAFTEISDWKTLKVQALVLIHPAFILEKPTDSTSNSLSLLTRELYHLLALPEGSEWGHPLKNPLHPQATWKLSELDFPAMLVAVASDDPIKKGAEEYYDALRRAGKQGVELFVSEGVGHCFHIATDPASHAALELEQLVVKFIHDHISA